MKAFLIVTLCTVGNFVKVEKFKLDKEEVDLTAFSAIKGVINGYFAIYKPDIDLFYCGPKSEALAQKLLREKPLEISIRPTKVEATDILPIHLPAIFLVDSNEHLDLTADKMVFQLVNSPKSQNLLVFNSERETQDIFGHESQRNTLKFLENANYIRAVNESTVDLITSFWFEEGKCWTPQFKAINRFSGSKWDNETFYPEKFDNFQGCPVKIAVEVSQHARASSTFDNIIDILSEKLNFTRRNRRNGHHKLRALPNYPKLFQIRFFVRFVL